MRYGYIDLSKGERLRQARKYLGLSQEMLAEALGINQTVVSKMEGDKSAITAEHLEALYKRYRISSDYLLHGITEIEVPKEQVYYAPKEVMSNEQLSYELERLREDVKKLLKKDRPGK